MKTLTESSPSPASQTFDPIQVDVSWLFKQASIRDGKVNFKLDRDDSLCLTPRRNPQTKAAEKFFSDLKNWSGKVSRFLLVQMHTAQYSLSSELKINTSTLGPTQVFLANLPLLQSNNTDPTLAADSNVLLKASFASPDEKLAELNHIFSQKDTLFSPKEASMVCILYFQLYISENLEKSLVYLENLIEQQIRDALGRHIGPADFDDYMRFHNRTFFNTAYQPKTFSYPIRRAGHVPEGAISLEHSNVPVQTISCTAASGPMFFTLDESTKVQFTGVTHLHGYLASSFEDNPHLSLSLTARARQFSSFVILIGKIVSKTQFEPEQAIVLQNKDEVLINLLTEMIPSAKQFKQAISSLSAEQKRFAEALRSMQLSSTLFSICVVQVKSQLEKVLNLPPDSLTKEIALTQDLMKLFVDFQIPSDLLSFDPSLLPQDAVASSTREMIKAVQKNTNEMLKIIQAEKDSQLKDKEQKAAFSKPETKGGLFGSSGTGAGGSVGFGSGTSGFGARGGVFVFGQPSFSQPASSTFSQPFSASFSSSSTSNAVPTMPSYVPTLQSYASTMPSSTPTSAPPGAFSAYAHATPPASIPPSMPSPPKPSTSTAPSNPEYAYDAPKVVNDLNEKERNLSKLPSLIDKTFEEFDNEGAVRPTILKTGSWTLKSREGLLGKATVKYMSKDDEKTEKQKTFDLLDALTKSGALALEDCQLHIVIAATHNFQKSLMGCLVQDNANPIEKVEASSVIMASCIHNIPFSRVIAPSNLERVKKLSVNLKL